MHELDIKWFDESPDDKVEVYEGPFNFGPDEPAVTPEEFTEFFSTRKESNSDIPSIDPEPKGTVPVSQEYLANLLMAKSHKCGELIIKLSSLLGELSYFEALFGNHKDDAKFKLASSTLNAYHVAMKSLMGANEKLEHAQNNLNSVSLAWIEELKEGMPVGPNEDDLPGFYSETFLEDMLES